MNKNPKNTAKAVTTPDQFSRIGTMVRYHRKEGALSQSSLADLAGVGKTVVFDVEKGKPTVQMDSLLKILSALNISIDFTSPLMERFKKKQEVSDEKR